MILGIESSCDETALAVFDPARGVAGEWVASQVDLHAVYGGVVPDLAGREHLSALPPLLSEAQAMLSGGLPTAVAVTLGPGLAPCLQMGWVAAKALGLALGVPVRPVNHLRGHAWSPFLPVHAAAPSLWDASWERLLPHLGLLVSGGNTVLFSLSHGGGVKVCVCTHDDAAGEAIDKGAKLLGLGYPGGPELDRRAARGNSRAFTFGRPIPERGDRRFSFSGLKTNLRNLVAEMGAAAAAVRIDDLCASYQEAVVEHLCRKTREELERAAAAGAAYRSLGLSGGVANNRRLRAQLAELAEVQGLAFLPAEPRHTGDNAAMIAFAAWVDAGLGLEADTGAGAPAILPVWPLERAVRTTAAPLADG